MKIAKTIKESRRLCLEGKWHRAVLVLQEGFQETGSSEIACELGLNLCLLGNEESAYTWFEKAIGSDNQDALWKILYEHFYCRKLLAVRREASDSVADETIRWLEKYRPRNYQMSHVGVSISACLIVKNEEQFLRNCLESLSGIVDEIIVVDTGSEDKTEEIAREFGARLGRFDWVDDFSAARNHAIKLASGNWILWIDADEILDLQSAQSIRNAIVRPHLGGYNLEIRNYIGESETEDVLIHCPCRLFRNLPNIRFEGRIHEQISPSLRSAGFPIATLDGAIIHHYGYRKEIMESKNKHQRTISLLKREVAEKPDDSFQMFNLGNAYYVADDYENAEKWLSACLGGIPQNADYGQLAYQSLAFCQLFQSKTELALQTCMNGERAGFEGQLIAYVKAFVYREQGQFDAALAAIEKCQQLSLKPNETGDRSIASYKAKYLQAEICFAVGQFAKAETLVTEINASTPGFVPAWKLRIECMRKQGKTLIETAQFAWTENRNSKELWQLWLDCLEESKDDDGIASAYIEAAEHFEFDDNLLVNAGRAMSNIGNHKVALQCFEDSIALNPVNTNAFLNLGDLLVKCGNYQDSCAAYSGAIMLDPENAQAWFVLGNSLYYSGKTGDAILALKQALKLNPEHTEAQSNLKTILSEVEELAS